MSDAMSTAIKRGREARRTHLPIWCNPEERGIPGSSGEAWRRGYQEEAIRDHLGVFAVVPPGWTSTRTRMTRRSAARQARQGRQGWSIGQKTREYTPQIDGVTGARYV